MNTNLLVGGIFGAVAVTAAGSYAGYTTLVENKKPQFAEVIESQPITETYYTDRQECYDEVVQHQAEVKDGNQVTGTVIGAVLGAVIGKQVGGGNGKKLATVAGAAAGGYAGNKVQKNMQQKDVYTTTEQRCNTVQDPHQKITGYSVTYQLDGKTETIVMDHKPESTIPVENGQLVLSAPASEKSETTQL
ncbi:glycine zipper 2TM domain-containing protein [Zhongshania sp.]|uniref:glycine zipper 2TM domain-containing protein n=1 Tax=Zhongshania sp. TaxID=1971902 RepID=UPI0026035C55|nr:glycine zipper 2TM domain-containing protein [Zhongshania sp.]